MSPDRRSGAGAVNLRKKNLRVSAENFEFSCLRTHFQSLQRYLFDLPASFRAQPLDMFRFVPGYAHVRLGAVFTSWFGLELFLDVVMFAWIVRALLGPALGHGGVSLYRGVPCFASSCVAKCTASLRQYCAPASRSLCASWGVQGARRAGDI